MAPNARIGEIIEIYDGLDSTNPDAALSANQGRILNQRLTALEEQGTGSTTTFTPAADADIDALFN